MTDERKKLERAAWRGKHPDFRGRRDDGTLVVLKLVEGQGTCSVPVSSLSDEELRDMARFVNGKKKP